MRLQDWFYVAPSRSVEIALDRTNRVSGVLGHMVEEGTLAGFWAVPLVGEDDFAEKDIDPDLVTGVTHGALPAVYLQLAYDLDRSPPAPSELEPLLRQLGFVHVLTDPPQPSAR